MDLFNGKKKKHLIEQINNGRLDKLSVELLSKYDYKVLLQLNSVNSISGFGELNEDEVILILNYIKKNGSIPSFQNFNINTIIGFNKELLIKFKDKNDYIIINKYVKKYGFYYVMTYLSNQNILKASELNEKELIEYVNKEKNEKQEREQKQQELLEIKKILSENNCLDFYDIIQTIDEAKAYVSFNNFMTENIKMDFSRLDKIVLYEKLKNVIINIGDFSKINDVDAINFINYINHILNKSDSKLYLEINNIEDLKNISEIRKNYFKNEFYNEPREYTLYNAIMPNSVKKSDGFIDEVYWIQQIEEICLDMKKLFLLYDEESLVKDFNLSKEEIEILRIISKVQEISKLPSFEQKEQEFIRLFNDFQQKHLDLGEVDVKKLRMEKVREMYGKEISLQLTKLNPKNEKQNMLQDVNYLGISENGVPIYEKDTGDFMFLIHAMPRDLVLNENIRSKYGKGTGDGYNPIVDNPELWCKMSKDIGIVSLSTSLISQDGLHNYAGNVYYGFDNFNYKDIRNISNRDGATSHKANQDTYSGGFEKMYLSNDLVKNTNYFCNEVAFKRYDEFGNTVLPNFILCYDIVDPISIKHAKFHNVPIVVIKTRKYIEKYQQIYEETKKDFYNLYNSKENLEEQIKKIEQLLFEIRRLLSFEERSRSKEVELNRNLYAEQEELEKLKVQLIDEYKKSRDEKEINHSI